MKGEGIVNDVWISAIVSGVISGLVGGALGARITLHKATTRQSSRGGNSPNISAGRDSVYKKP